MNHCLSLTPLLRDLQRNRLTTLQIDRRTLHGVAKFGSTSTLSTIALEDSETEDTEDETSMTEDDVEDLFFGWTMLVARIRKASGIQHAILHDNVLPTLPAEKQAEAFGQLLQALPSLPHMQQLRIYVANRDSLDFALLQSVVQRCRALEQLILCDNLCWDVHETALGLRTATQVQHLADAIRYHPTLTAVSVQECRVAPHLTLDPILEALATVPRLEMINLTPAHQPTRQRLSDAALVRLLRIPTLQDVTLWCMGLDDQHLEALQGVLPTHPALVFLSLRNNAGITAAGWHTLCDMVQQNYVLRSVYTDELVAPTAETHLQNLLYWNQCGRGELLASDDPTVWQETVVRWKDNPTALYYLVRQGHARWLRQTSRK